jgi:hypothetical protein
VNAVGIDRARELLDYGNQPISGASKLGVFLLGIVETWREADV